MNMIHPKEEPTPGEIQRPRKTVAPFFLHFLLPLILLAAGTALTLYMIRTAPVAKPGKRSPTAVLVEVMPIQPGLQTTRVEAMGEIVPAREVDLKPQVTGEIIEVGKEFLPGGYFTAGQTILHIDPTDYRLALDQLQSQAEQVASDLKMEMGNQQIAAKEFTLINEQVSSEERALILRQPQLAKLKAERASTLARLEQARLNLARTEVKAPFNGVITGRSTDLGARVSESTVLARLVGTDVFWLRLTLPVEQLRWLHVPQSTGESGSPVHITVGSTGRSRTGEVIRLEAALESQGRMAQLLVAIDDPLCLKEENKNKPQLLLGSFVTAEIIGTTIENGVSLDRSHVHDGDTVWLMDNNGQLEIRMVKPLFRDRDRLIVTDGLHDGELLVTNTLTSPVAGTRLRLAEQPVETHDSNPGRRSMTHDGQHEAGNGE